jgi:hypothetical protein
MKPSRTDGHKTKSVSYKLPIRVKDTYETKAEPNTILACCNGRAAVSRLHSDAVLPSLLYSPTTPPTGRTIIYNCCEIEKGEGEKWGGEKFLFRLHSMFE